jgi:hypothetical protein
MITGMSRIYFHAPHRTAEVGGSERAYFGEMSRRVALGILDPRGYASDREWLEPLMVGRSYSFREEHWALDFKTWFGGMDHGGFKIGENVVGCGELALNTLIAMNSPQLSFVAHVHGLCESHVWCETENAGWMGDLIEKGRDTGVFRSDQGWEDVILLCREVAETGEGPIVTSYSISDDFPSRSVAGWVGDNNKWYELSGDERWALAVKGLREAPWPFAMGPDRQGQRYLTGESVFDLLATRWAGQLAR